ncbi:MAG: hypothetical protein KZQ58_11600 [gamma proteobacterium symbiont of Bathyaustriella thionipta]|nr:hypothetical protein [gamma proteobacterium symbiont of Bathyaustriella thionipta]
MSVKMKTPLNRLNEDSSHEMAGLWALRVLINFNGIARLTPYNMTADADMLKTIGLEHLLDTDITQRLCTKVHRLLGLD